MEENDYIGNHWLFPNEEPKEVDELRDEGYKSYEDKLRHRRLEQALREYDQHLMNPYG